MGTATTTATATTATTTATATETTTATTSTVLTPATVVTTTAAELKEDPTVIKRKLAVRVTLATSPRMNLEDPSVKGTPLRLKSFLFPSLCSFFVISFRDYKLNFKKEQK